MVEVFEEYVALVELLEAFVALVELLEASVAQLARQDAVRVGSRSLELAWGLAFEPF